MAENSEIEWTESIWISVLFSNSNKSQLGGPNGITNN